MISLELDSVNDLLTILCCLETKEFALEGRLDPRVPRDLDGKSVMDAVEMTDSIEAIRKRAMDYLTNL